MKKSSIKNICAVVLSSIMVISLVSCSEENTDEHEETVMPEVLADFSGEYTDVADKFIAADGWTNGGMFNCTWKTENCTFENESMQLTINELMPDMVTPVYTGGEFRSHDFYSFGYYEVSMKPIKNDGVVSSFFTYTGPSDNNPWDEIDIEFLGKNTSIVQFNYFTNGKGQHEHIYELGFDASEDFHTYGFYWEADKITWYVDGVEVYSATEDIPQTPSKIMMNVWNGINVDGWLKPYDGTVPISAEYKYVDFREKP